MNFKKNIILDGAMGTILLNRDVVLSKVPEEINITDPDAVIRIHKEYIDAGCDVLYTNTFGVNGYKNTGAYSTEALISAAVNNAHTAINGNNIKIALSVGPIGMMLEPNGKLKFEQAYEYFKEIVCAGEKANVDLVVFETMFDLNEIRAAILATRENTSLPIWTTMTFEKNMRTFTGVTAAAFAVTATAMNVQALGINCSLGPNEMIPIVNELVKYSPLPIIVKANAGLPNVDNGEYDISALDFYNSMEELYKIGVSIFGGCCGTTPEYIKFLSDNLKDKAPIQKIYDNCSFLCSSTSVVCVDQTKIVGERINPTGKKKFKEALINKDMSYIMAQALEQVKAGAHILDVNVGLPEINETEMMVTVVKQLSSLVSCPLQIDSSNPDAIEAALRIYPGKALVNSVNGDDESLERILPIVKKYGASVIGLTLDKNGIPACASERVIIAKKIVDTAVKFGISKEDIYIDCLTLTVSAEQEAVTQTLDALEMVKKELGVKTVLGVSNISFGLPNRELVNTTFFTLALAKGLDLAIINPNITSMTDALSAFNLLHNRDKGAISFIAKYNVAAGAPVNTVVSDITLDYAVSHGLKDAARTTTELLLKSTDSLDIINDILIPALDYVGKEFEKGKLFLPQLIQSSTAAQAAFEAIKAHIKSSGSIGQISKGKIILATVQGDIHDIGKNIVKVVLENYGFEVYDLGKDVAPEVILAKVQETGTKLVGLSALMTTTVINMEKTIKILKENTDCKIIVGGAVLTQEYAMKIGADYYAADAKVSADIAKQVLCDI